MKKVSIILIFVLLAVFSLSAVSNGQKIYPVDSKEYEDIRYLYLITGHALPSTTGPWSEDELLRMAEKIDPALIPSGAVSVYDDLLVRLNPEKAETCPDFSMKWGFDAYLETYTHTNTGDERFIGRYNWNYSVVNHKPFFSIKLETWPVSSFYGYAELSVMNYLHTGKGSQPEFGETVFNTNIPMFQNPPTFTMNLLSFNVPYRAFAAFGGNHWSVQVGRDRMSWGPGVTGNFVVGDNLLYHNMARFTTYFDSFKYTFATSFFPHPSLYASNDPAAWGGGGDQHQLMNGINMFMAHRLEWRILKDRMNIVLTEGIMYQSEENYLDLQVLNPCMIFHNYYIRSNANSILSLELDFTPVKGLNLYGQLVIDEYALPGEPVPGKKDGALPDGKGFMAGARTAFTLGNGIFHASLEGAKTDPYLYLRDKSDYKQEQGEYGINWVVAVRNFSEAEGNTYDESFLGYKYGGDAVVANFNAGYRSADSWHAEFNAFFMLHGTHDMWTLWSKVKAADYTSGPTESHITGNNKDATAQSTRNAVSKTLVVGVNGGYVLDNGISLNCQLDCITVWNPGNVKSASPVSDIQLTVGVGFSF